MLMYVIFFLLPHCATSHLVPVKKTTKYFFFDKFLTENTEQDKTE